MTALGGRAEVRAANRGDVVRQMRRSVVPMSALVFGVSGWVVAHLVTTWLLAHQHEAAHGVAAGIGHVHSRDAAFGVLLAALLAVAGVASWRRDTPAGARNAGRWSLAVFLAAEVAGFAFSEAHVVPPPLVLLAGAGVHVLSGAIAAVLCRRTVEGVLVAAAAVTGVPSCADRSVRRGFGSPARRRSLWLSLRPPGRAPPRRWVSAEPLTR